MALTVRTPQDGHFVKVGSFEENAILFQDVSANVTILQTPDSSLVLVDRIIISNAGLVTLENGLTLTAGDLTITAGDLIVDQAAEDTNAILLRSSDVATVLTTIVNGPDVTTEDYFAVAKTSATLGGAHIMSLAEDAALAPALVIESYGGTATGTKTTAGRALIELYATEHDGANALANIAADGNVFGVRARIGAADVQRFMVDEDGDVFVVTVVAVTATTGNAVSAAAFDDYDDSALLDAYDQARAPAVVIRQEWADWARYNEQTLIDTGILGGPLDEGGMTNMTQLQRAEVGAIRQLTEDLMSIASLLPPESRNVLTPRMQARLRALEAAR